MSISTEVVGGVEISVETGTATVLGTQPKARNVQVTLDDPARSASLKYEVRGWVDKADTEALALAERVKGTGTLVSYRIEVHRAKDIDASLPIAAVPATPQARHRRLVSLTEAVAAPNSGTTAPNSGTEPAPWDDLPPANGSPGVASAAPNVALGPPNVALGPACNNFSRRGPRVQEAKPWEPTNTDGSPNLGSYEVLAAVGMTELAHTLMLARAQEAGHQVFSLDTMRKLARTFLTCADRVQAAVRADGHADRMDNSHSRARGAVRTALEAYPVPWDAGMDEKAAWVEDLVRWGTEILRCAMGLAQEPVVRDVRDVRPPANPDSRETPAAVSTPDPRQAGADARHTGAGSAVDTGSPETGVLATEEERQLALAAARRVDDTDASRDRNGDTAYDRLAHWMHAQGIPPLISKKLTSEQALRFRAYLANSDAAGAAA